MKVRVEYTVLVIAPPGLHIQNFSLGGRAEAITMLGTSTDWCNAIYERKVYMTGQDEACNDASMARMCA